MDEGPTNGGLAIEAALQEGVEPSAGISSSQSESRPDKSGSSPPVMESSTPLPAPTTESPSGPDQPAGLAPFSSVSSVDGSTQETGSVPLSPPGSSVELQPATQPIQDPSSEGPSEEIPASGGFLVPNPELARQKYSEAGDAYRQGNFDGTMSLLDEVVRLDPSMLPEVDQARQAVTAARQ